MMQIVAVENRRIDVSQVDWDVIIASERDLDGAAAACLSGAACAPEPTAAHF